MSTTEISYNSEQRQSFQIQWLINSIKVTAKTQFLRDMIISAISGDLKAFLHWCLVGV